MGEIINYNEFGTLPKRKNSLRKLIYDSFRLKKKPSINVPSPTVEEDTTPTVYYIETTKNRLVSHVTPRDDLKSVFGNARTIQGKECSLVKFFPAEGKAFDPDCKLTSFERKMRARQEFSEAKHCNLQLFCPEQASQIELRFTNSSIREVIIRVTAPNGEVSDILHPKNAEPALFAPSKVGCGHGRWLVEVAVRNGIRFKSLSVHALDLNGQGIPPYWRKPVIGSLTYDIDHKFNLKLVEQLWLSFH